MAVNVLIMWCMHLAADCGLGHLREASLHGKVTNVRVLRTSLPNWRQWFRSSISCVFVCV